MHAECGHLHAHASGPVLCGTRFHACCPSLHVRAHPCACSAVSERVVVDGTLTTSRGPGTAFEFALSLVKQLYGEEKMNAVAGPMVMHAFKLP